MTLTRSDYSELDELFPLGSAAGAEEGGADAAPVLLPETLLSVDNKALTTAGIRKRRKASLIGYTGLNGTGKSMLMVRDLLPALAQGKTVLSTVQLLDPESGNPHPNCILLRSWSQFHGFRDGEIVLDEITGVMDARESGMPKHVKKMLPQQRREGNRVSWTGISFDNADKRLRQITKAVVRMRGFMPVRDRDALWAPNRLFLATTYDGQTLAASDDSDQLTEDRSRKKRARVLNRELIWGPGSLAFRCYDTLSSVESVDNSCPQCGGRIPEKVCRGHDRDR